MRERVLDWMLMTLTGLVFVLAEIGAVAVCVHVLGFKLWVASLCACALTLIVLWSGIYIAEQLDNGWYP